MDHITELFCILDDFCKKFNESLEKALISDQKSKLKKSALSLSEAMTIVILFHQSGFRFFKYFYCQMIVPFWKSAFPKLLSYNRFIEIMPRCLQALSSFFHQVKGKDTGISIIDSTKLVVCHNLRIKRHRVFKGLAGRGKSSTGWFYGFKLHLVINNLGEIINLKLTSGNVHDVAIDLPFVTGCIQYHIVLEFTAIMEELYQFPKSLSFSSPYLDILASLNYAILNAKPYVRLVILQIIM